MWRPYGEFKAIRRPLPLSAAIRQGTFELLLAAPAPSLRCRCQAWCESYAAWPGPAAKRFAQAGASPLPYRACSGSEGLRLTAMRITSTANPRVKQAQRLRDHRERTAQGRFLIDGRRELLAALAAGVKVRQAFVCPELPSAASLTETIQALRQYGAELLEVSPAVMQRLAYGQRNEGVVAVAEAQPSQLEQLRLPQPALVAVLEGVEKPGNLGAILRSADAAGVAAVLLADTPTDIYNPNCIRASQGALFHVPVCAAGGEQIWSWLTRRQFRLFAARVDAAVEYTRADLRGNVALVLGSEAHGLSKRWRATEVTGIRLPMLGHADSLNVAAAAAVLFYEALRQRSTAANLSGNLGR